MWGPYKSFHRTNVIGTGKLRGKFLTQEAVRDPDFVCAERDCGPAHRLGLRADAFVDLLRTGSVGLGVGGGVLAFGGTISTMVVEHPTFEKSLWSGHVGPSVSWRSDAAYAALSPVVDVKRETTLGGDSFTSLGGGITAAMGLIRSRFGIYANGRYLSHPQSSGTESRFGELYPEAGIEARTVRVVLDQPRRIHGAHPERPPLPSGGPDAPPRVPRPGYFPVLRVPAELTDRAQN